jgi:hypothetical protein
MPTVFGYHDVTDTAHWLASPKREEVFGPMGVTNIRTFVNPQERTKVGVMFDVPDLDAFLGALDPPAPEMIEAMQHDGVLPETLVILIEERA